FSIHLSLDGGATWTDVGGNVHFDHHAQAFTPDGNKLYIGNDGGVWSTTSPTNPANNWTNLNATIATTMFYPGLSIDPGNLNTTFAGTQDNHALHYNGTLAWTETFVCGDAGRTAIDFLQPQNVYVACALTLDIKKTAASC